MVRRKLPGGGTCEHAWNMLPAMCWRLPVVNRSRAALADECTLSAGGACVCVCVKCVCM